MRAITRWLVWCGGIGGAICLLLYLLVFDVWLFDPGNDAQLAASAVPALKPGDKVLLRRGSTPGFGELVRCEHPDSPGTWVVGRIFGVRGDRVEVSDGTIQTNGKGLSAAHGCPQQVVPHPVTQNLVTLSCGVVETGAWSFEYLNAPEHMSGGTHSALVEAGKVYLVSDNRFMHQDSRDFGQVDETTCRHVVFRLWGESYTDSSRRFTVLW
ncbi:MAG: signal peptidase I [Labilithrix sp.]|nr:signal peptidase I [Labilithrix sp.]MCW5810264.1 signal peptidase I [Labilithrix sp.]